jgi:hypothetical protein
MQLVTFFIYLSIISLVSSPLISSSTITITQFAHASVLETKVSCIKTGLTGGLNLTKFPEGKISGSQVLDILRQADSLAIEMAGQAEAALAVIPYVEPESADPDTVDSLESRFGLSLSNPTHLKLIPKLEFEYKQVKGFLDRGEAFYICRDGSPENGSTVCEVRQWHAFIRAYGEHTIRLCNSFWNLDLEQQAATILHEAFHIWWKQIEDDNVPRIHNAHCFEQFASDQAGTEVREGPCRDPGSGAASADDMDTTDGGSLAGGFSDDTQKDGFGESTDDTDVTNEEAQAGDFSDDTQQDGFG